jgi:hypothetical protein
MNRYTFASLLVLPALAPPASAGILLVEYEGTVAQVESWPSAPDFGYAVGDSIKGVLEIDTAIAPPDLFDWTPLQGAYRVVEDQESPNFVTGDRLTSGRHWDIVHVLNEPGRDEYGVTDRADATSPTSYSRIFSLTAVWPEGGPITDDGLSQSFEAVPAKDGSVLSGLIQRVRGGMNFFTTTISLSVNRMEVCSK